MTEEADKLAAEYALSSGPTGILARAYQAAQAEISRLTNKNTDWCVVCKRGWCWVGGNVHRHALDRAKAAESALAAARAQAERLFDVIAHGDDEHRRWLKQAIEDHFAGRVVPTPRGRNSAEVIAELRAQAERDKAVIEEMVETLRVISALSVYEWSETREQLHAIINANRAAASSALAARKEPGHGS